MLMGPLASCLHLPQLFSVCLSAEAYKKDGAEGGEEGNKRAESSWPACQENEGAAGNNIHLISTSFPNGRVIKMNDSSVKAYIIFVINWHQK